MLQQHFEKGIKHKIVKLLSVTKRLDYNKKVIII